MEIDNETEATMSDTATTRYGYAPQAMFAATLAGAERQAREITTAAALAERRTRPAGILIRRLTALVGTSRS